MSTSPDRQISNMDGYVALPRKNGELVFEAPWESRAFGMAVALNEGGFYHWHDFHDSLVAEIAAAEQSGAPSKYYERWLASLEKLAIAKGFITLEELEKRTGEYASGECNDDDSH
jgi:nitrile hydratase accessory protein